MGIRKLSTAAFVASLLVAAGVVTALASSHREAPGIAKDPTADNTDVYAFVSPDDSSTVTFISNWLPLLEPAGGPNFYQFDDAARYWIFVDNQGDARDHIAYQFKFTTEIRNGDTFLYNTGPITSLDDPDFNIRQFYDVIRYDNGEARVLGRHLAVPPNRVGDASTPDYASLVSAAVHTLSDGSKVFAGEVDDPFFVDLGATFDLLTIRRLPGDTGGGVDGLGGFNTLTIALQVPKRSLIGNGEDEKDEKGGRPVNTIIGVYSTTTRPQSRGRRDDESMADQASDEFLYSGSDHQVSRLGAPLVNEVVIPLKDKDRWNASRPRRDGQFLKYVVNPELAGLLHALYGINVPPTPRNDLVAVFLTGVPGLTKPAKVRPAELLRLNLAIAPSASPNRLGVLGGDLAGFPNGRRLADDVVDIELRAVAGVLVPGFNIEPNNRLGDGVDENDAPFLPQFPYLALANNALNHDHHRLQSGHPAGAPSEFVLPIGETPIIGSQDDAVPGEELSLAGPNPAGRHEIQYAVGRPSHVTLKVYDLQGREVRSLIDQQVEPGSFRASWDGTAQNGRSAGRGVFFARFTMDGTVVSIRKLVVR